MEELKEAQKKASSQASELHAKELEALREELSSSRSTAQELEKEMSELRPYKEQSEVSTAHLSLVRRRCFNERIFFCCSIFLPSYRVEWNQHEKSSFC